jgi:prepilin-type N-terminal cleavage/methylation domain-containing protein
MWTFLRHFRSSSPKGFTLLELLVVITLMVLITAAILVRQARFDSSTLLRSLSYSIALSARQAQVYGTSVVGVSSGGGTVFAPAYGVYFNNTTSYIVYADVNGNGTYDSGTDTVIQTYQVGAGFQISQFCGVRADSSRHCSTDGSPISWLSVYFKRPNPDGFFSDSAGDTITGAYIQVAAINDSTNTHSIIVTSTGQIAVGAAGT